jgi:predicted RNA-binding Zn-ribbon protein involved in translation (DUF1610 family)
MTIERDGRERMISCESCSSTLAPFDQDEFNEMVADAKAHGWKIRNEDGTWSHVCPNCQESPLDRARRLLG